MGSIGGRRRSQKHPVELRERAVRIVLEIRAPTGERHGAGGEEIRLPGESSLAQAISGVARTSGTPPASARVF